MKMVFFHFLLNGNGNMAPLEKMWIEQNNQGLQFMGILCINDHQGRDTKGPLSHIHLPKSWGLSVGKEPRKPHCSNFLFPPTLSFGGLQVLLFGRRTLQAWSPSLVTLSQSSAAMGSPWGIFGSHLTFEVVGGDTTTSVSSGCSLF